MKYIYNQLKPSDIRYDTHNIYVHESIHIFSEQYNEIRNNADDAGCSASSHEYSRNTKPAITSIDKVELDLNQVYKSSTGVDNRNKPKGTRNSTSYGAQQTKKDNAFLGFFFFMKNIAHNFDKLWTLILGDSNDAHEKKRKTADIQHPKVSRQRTRDAEGDGGNVQRLENEDQPLHANANDMIEAGNIYETLLAKLTFVRWP